jgi:hypothetical protein
MTPLLLEVAVHEVEVAVPVVGGYVVLAGTDVIADVAGDGLVEGGHFGRHEALFPEHSIDPGGFDGRLKLAFRVGFAVEFGAANVCGAGRYQ